MFKKIFFVLLLLFLFVDFANANTTNTFYPSTVIDQGGNRSWNTTSNLVGNTTNTSTNNSLPKNQTTNQLLINNLGINSSILPSDAQINGIRVLVERQASSGNINDSLIQLTKDGINSVGLNKATGNAGPTTKSITQYGSENDLWGTSWTASELYSPDFGLYLSYNNSGIFSNGSQSLDIYRVGFIIDYTPSYNPGGSSSNLSLWFKSNNGTSTNNDGDLLNNWYDQSGNGKNATSVNPPTFLNNSNDNLNFYPLVDFNGTQYLEGLNNGGYSNSYTMVMVPNQDVNGTISGQVPFGFNCNTGILSSGTCGLPFSGLTLGAFTIAIADEVITHAIGSSTNWRSSQIGNANYDSSKPMLLTVNSDNISQTTNIYEKGIQIDNFTANNYQTLENADFTIGRSSDLNNPFPYNGKIAEIINFSDSLSTIDKQKIESYLAVKYGMTLSKGNIDYLDSLGNVVYDSSLNTNFNNDIFAIARDDTSGLGQVESKTVNDSGIMTIRGQSQGTNINPIFTTIDDLEYLFVSNNNFSNTWVDYPGLSGYDLLDRKWLIQETGDTGLIDLNFDVNNTFFDIPNLNSGTNYYFVYDSNNDGLFSDETPVSMNNLGGGIWGVQGINLQDGNMFTLATESSLNNIPSDITLSDNSLDENNDIGYIVGTLNTLDLDSGDNHIYSLVSGSGDNDNNSFSISGDNLLIEESADYEIKPNYNIRIQTDDGNGGVYQKEFQINILNTVEVINSIIDFETSGKYNVISGIWNRDGNDVFEGIFSLESGNVGQSNTQTCFEVENTFQGVGTIDFKYRVSSESGGDFLRFYIDNVEQQSWSGDIPWSTYNKNDINSGTHTYKWCYIKDGSIDIGDDKSYIDYITFYDTFPDSDSPIIDNTNFNNDGLLPGGNHDIIINYSDIGTGIDSSSAVLKLYKWDGISWGSNIASTYINTNSISNSEANYSMVNMDYGRYLYEFEIRDNYGNNTIINIEFYIDKPEFYINSGTYLSKLGENYSSDELIVTVKTIGAPFDVEIFKQDDFDDNRGNIIFDWNGSLGVGYDINPYSGISSIPDNPILGSEVKNLNINGQLNEYTYVFKVGALIDEEQAAGDYKMNLGFNLILDY